MSCSHNFYSINDIRQIEQLAFKKRPSFSLMQKAGSVAWQQLLKHYPKVQHIQVFCGSGNNGGDGFVLAYHAFKAGLKVHVFIVGDSKKLSADARLAYQMLEEVGIKIYPFDKGLIKNQGVLVDALLGIGLKGQLCEPYLSVIKRLNQINLPKVAIDVPSGLDAESGTVMGEALVADLTVTFIALKQGLLTNDAFDYCGKLVIEDLGLKACINTFTPRGQCISHSLLRSLIKKRPQNSHKGDFGHVLILAGDKGMGGAARLCAEAALRVGSGRVTVLTHKIHINSIVSACPELMCYGLEEKEEIVAFLKTADALLCGPGLIDSPWSKMMIESALTFNGPKLVDAGALNYLDNHRPLSNAILTPHPGEAARLLRQKIKDIQARRYHAAIELAYKFKATVVLKGAGTIIKDSKQSYVANFASSGLATAGMGDVLAGMIAGFLAQTYSLKEACILGVGLQIEAAKLALKDFGEHALIASQLFDYFSLVLKPLEKQFDKVS